MKRYQLTATAEQPILIDERLMDRGNVLRSAPYIPGASLRGAFAGALLRQIDERHPFFRAAIVEERLSFGPLLPIAKPLDGWTSPMPASARGCKLEKTNHPLSDLVFHGMSACPSCGYKQARLSGWLRKDKEGFAFHKDPKSHLLTSVGLDNRLESAREGQLFSRQVLSEGNLFRGTVALADDLDPQVLTGITSLRVGLAKTSGFGKINLSWVALADEQEARKQRLLSFQDKARSAPTPLLEDQRLGEGEQLVTLDLLSPLVLSDVFNNPRLQLEARDLQAYGPGLSWRVLHTFGQITQIGGWYSLINRPKQHRPALAAGAVIQLAVKGERAALLQALERLEHYGLGQGWGAGYGHLVTNHPFHLKQDLHLEVPQ